MQKLISTAWKQRRDAGDDSCWTKLQQYVIGDYIILENTDCQHSNEEECRST